MKYLNGVILLNLFIVSFFISTILYACNSDKNNNHPSTSATQTPIEHQSLPVSDISSNQTVPPPPDFKSDKLELKIYEVIDSVTKKSKGWGYDIIIGTGKIHQPTIPAIQGYKSFVTKEEAQKTGTFALNKMKKTGAMPTITIRELDSLGITK